MVEILVPNPEVTKRIELVLLNHSESRNWLQSSGYLSEWRDWNNLYRSVADKKPETWMSNKFIPLTCSIVEAAHANLQALFFSANPYFQVRPKESKDTANAKIMQKLLQSQLNNSNAVYAFMQFIRSLCIYGTAIGMISWDRRFDHRTVLKDVYKPVEVFGLKVGQRLMGQQPKNEQYISFDGPVFTNLNLGDVFPDPTSIEIQDGWVVVRGYQSLDYLKNMNKYYPDTYNEEVLKIEKTDSTNIKRSSAEIQADLSRLNNIPTTMPEKTNPQGKVESDCARIETLTRWGMDYDPEDGVLKQRVLTVAAGKYLIRNTNTPFWHGKLPFIKGTYIPVENEFYGVGIPELCEDLQTSINETVNQKNDNISLALNRIIVYSKDASININKLQSKPGIKIGYDGLDPNVIKFLDIPMNTRDATMFTAECERWLQEVTSVTKMTLGIQGSDNNDTATGMSILNKASGNRFMAIARTLEQTSFQEMLRMYYMLSYQYVTVKQMVRIIGDQANEWVAVSPEDVRRDYDLIPAGIFTLENKAQQALKLIQFKQITKDDPTIRQTVLNQKIYSALEIGDNPNEIMFEDAQMREITKIAQMMAVQMIQKSMAGNGMPGAPKKPGGGSAAPNAGTATKGSVVGSAQVPPPTPPSAGQPPQL
jgi:hypothetical protein